MLSASVDWQLLEFVLSGKEFKKTLTRPTTERSPPVPNIFFRNSRELAADLSILAVPFIFSSGLSVTVIVVSTNETDGWPKHLTLKMLICPKRCHFAFHHSFGRKLGKIWNLQSLSKRHWKILFKLLWSRQHLKGPIPFHRWPQIKDGSFMNSLFFTTVQPEAMIKNQKETLL